MENSENHYTDFEQKLQQVERHLEEVRIQSPPHSERKSLKPPSEELCEDPPYISDKAPMRGAHSSSLKMSPTRVEKISSPAELSPLRSVRNSLPDKVQEMKIERSCSPIATAQSSMNRNSSNTDFGNRAQERTNAEMFESLKNFGLGNIGNLGNLGNIGNLPIFPQNQVLPGNFPQMSMPTGSPDQIQRLLIEQAERLEQMVYRMKSPQVPRNETEMLQAENARLKEQLAILQKIMTDRCIKLEQQNLMLMQQAQRSFQPANDMLIRQKDQELANLKKELDIAKHEGNSIRSQDDLNYRQQQDSQRQMHELERHLYDTQKNSKEEKAKMLAEMNELRHEIENLHYSNNSMALEKEKLSEDIEELKQALSNSSSVNNNKISDKYLKEVNSLKECIKNLEKQINDWSTSYYQLQKEMNQLIMDKHSYGRVSEKYDKSGVSLEEDKVNRSYRTKINSSALSTPKSEPRSNYESSRSSPTRNLSSKAIANESSNVSNALIWNDPESKQGYDSQQHLTFPSFQSAQNNTQIITNLEQKLMELQQDYEKLQNEYERLPENSRNIATMKKKKDLELDISIIDTNINSIKTKLRKYK